MTTYKIFLYKYIISPFIFTKEDLKYLYDTFSIRFIIRIEDSIVKDLYENNFEVNESLSDIKLGCVLNTTDANHVCNHKKSLTILFKIIYEYILFKYGLRIFENTSIVCSQYVEVTSLISDQEYFGITSSFLFSHEDYLFDLFITNFNKPINIIEICNKLNIELFDPCNLNYSQDYHELSINYFKTFYGSSFEKINLEYFINTYYINTIKLLR